MSVDTFSRRQSTPIINFEGGSKLGPVRTFQNNQKLQKEYLRNLLAF